MAPKIKLAKELAESRYAESAVVGSCLIDCTVIPLVIEICSSKDFVHEDIRELMVGVEELWDKIQAVDGLMLRQWLEDKGKKDKDEIVIFIHQVLDSVPHSSNAEYYARIVKSKSYERSLVAALDKLGDDIYDKSLSIEEKKYLFEQAALSISIDFDGEDKNIKAVALKIWESLNAEENKTLCINTGYPELDEHISGFEPGEIAIIAARPSQGKTTMMMEIAMTISVNMPVLFLSMEQNKESLVYRILAYVTRFSIRSIKSKLLHNGQMDVLKKAIDTIERYKIIVDETPMLTPTALTAKIMKAKAQYNIGCVFVDYLQLMHIPNWRSDNRVTEITRICSSIKAAAKKAKVPIIVASQMSRAVESRSEPEPRLSDLRESGAIEQDADYVIFLYPAKLNLDKNYKDFEPGPNDPHVQKCKIAKQRQGVKDIVVDLYWQPAYYTFRKRQKDSDIF